MPVGIYNKSSKGGRKRMQKLDFCFCRNDKRGCKHRVLVGGGIEAEGKRIFGDCNFFEADEPVFDF